MRVGFNPNRNKVQETNDYFHQFVIPVYIPNQEGYYKDSFQILQYCLESVLKTSHSQTFISIVDNGSCVEVQNYLHRLYNQGKIHELINTINIGKINAVLKGISGQNFEIITVTDADVLFLNNWQQETYDIFEKFPKAGAICPTPSPKMLKRYTFNVLFEKFRSKKLQFTDVKNPKALMCFAESIGNSKFYEECHLAYNLTISNENKKAVLGAAHFVASYRGEIFNKFKHRYSNFGLGGDSEEKFLDRPVVNQGYWRLSTEDNFAYHMGNVAEPWMQEQLINLEDHSKTILSIPVFKKIFVLKFWNLIKEKIFMNILNKKGIWIRFLQFKGLDKETARKY